METPTPSASPNSSPETKPAPTRDRVDLASFLAEHDAPCPVCGYNLRALLTDRCPECGRHLVLAVGTTEPKLGAFITGLIGLASGFGFCGLLLAYLVLFILSRVGGGPPPPAMLSLLAGTVTCGVGIWVWLKLRPRLGRSSTASRWSWAVASCLVGLACPVWFILAVR